MKSNVSGQADCVKTRIIELYKHATLSVVHNENGQSFIFTCRAAVPENVSDVTLQAIKDNCAITIILKRQLSPFRTAGEALLMPLPLSGVGKTAFASEIAQKYLSKCPKFDAATVRRGMTFRKFRSGQ